MTRRAAILAAGLFGLATSLLAEDFLGWDQTATNHVASGTKVQTDIGVIGAGAKVYKTGNGTWDVHSSVIRQNGGTIGVREGRLNLTIDDLTGPQSSIDAPAVMDNAFVHLDMSVVETRPDLFDGDGEVVEKWYDVREAGDRIVPAHIYAEAVAFQGISASAPEVRSYGGNAGLWFGGLGGGHFMHLKMPGGGFLHDQSSAVKNSIRHLFAVHAVESSLGAIFGKDGAESNYLWEQMHFIPGSFYGCGKLFSAYLSNGMMSGLLRMGSARFYENGERIDGFSTIPRIGELSVFEIDSSRFPIGVDAIFTAGHESQYTGGDYLFEIVAFTNQLAESDRECISEFLRRKWSVRSSSTKGIALAEGTSAEVNALDDGAVILSGSGDVVKRGSGTLTVRIPQDAPFTGKIDMKAGCVRSETPIGIAVPDGSRITTSMDGRGVLYSLTEGTAGRLVKDGEGTLCLASIPAETLEVKVDAGTLSFACPDARETLAPGTAYVVPLLNPGFEEYFSGEHVGDYAPKFSRTDNDPVCGWYGSFYFANLKNWTMSTPKQSGANDMAAEATRSAFGFKWNAPEGDSVLIVRGKDGYAAQSVTLPSAGTYRLTGSMSARNGSHGHAVEISLLDENGTSCSLGPVVYQNDSGDEWLDYARFEVRGKVSAAGIYTLKISGTSTSGGTISLDDLKLVRLPDTPSGVVNIPGGDFENVDWRAIATETGDSQMPKRYNAANRPAEWTFTQPDGVTQSNPGVAAVLTFYAGYRNLSDLPLGGNNGLLFSGKNGNGAKASTTFTASTSGTYFLRARFATEGSTLNGLAASMSVAGGEEISLGTVYPTCKSTWRRYLWAKPVVLHEGDAVSLTLTGVSSATSANFNVSGLSIDDLELVRADESVELVSDGSFEAGTSTWLLGTRRANWEYSTIFQFTGSALYDHFSGNSSHVPAEVVGGSRPEGVYGLLLHNWVYANSRNNVVIAEAGVYHCSFLAHRVVNTTVPGETYRYHEQTLRLWLEDVETLATNVLVEAVAGNDEFTRYSADVYLAPGTYALYIEGMSADGGGSGMNMLKKHAAVVDDISIRRSVMNRLRPTPFPEAGHIEVSVAKGAKLDLSFSGTNEVNRVRYDGRSIYGVIDSTTCPEFVTGPGAFWASRKGILITVF